MTFKRMLPLFLFGAMSAAMAQVAPDDPDWKETEAPPPPAFSVDRLVAFEGSAASNLVFGVDPATLSISQTDGLVRYVLVAKSASGATNVVYEALRCSTGEVKLYARFAGGRWSPVAQPVWRSVFDGPNYSLRFARAGGCQNAAVPNSPAEIVSRLKNGEGRINN